MIFKIFTKIMKFRGTPQIYLFFQGKCNGNSIESQPPELLINVRGNQCFFKIFTEIMEFRGGPELATCVTEIQLFREVDFHFFRYTGS